MKSLNSFVLLFFVFLYVGSIHAQTFFSKSTGDLNDPTTWGTNSDGSGTGPGANFLGAKNFVVCNRSNAIIATGSAVWQLSNTGTITIGDGVSAINFTINSTDYIEEARMNVAANATVTVLAQDLSNVFNTITSFTGLGFNDLNVSSTVIYDVFGAFVAVPKGGFSYGNLMINDNADLIGSITTASLEVASGKTLNVNSNQLEITTDLLGSGMLSASSGTLFFNIASAGSGSRGTLNVAGTVKTLELNALTTNYITLGTDVTVGGSGGAFINNSTSGLIDLNGHKLLLNNDITFPTNTSSVFRGSANSSLLIAGLGTITNPTIRFDPSANTLKVLGFNNPGSLTVGTNPLNITDSLSVLDGTFNTSNLITLKSTSSLKGRVSRLGGIVSGNITIETFIPGGATGWANLGVSGVIGQTVANWDTWTSSNTANGIPMVCTGCAYSQTAMTNWFTSIAGWDEATDQYDTTVIVSTPLTIGRGFWVYVGDGFSVTNDLMLVNTGPIAQGLIQLGLSHAGNGYNLVANPYPSPVGWSKILSASGGTASGISDAIYVWNADLGVTTSLSNGFPSHSSGITNVIPAGQAFYVETSAYANLLFSESVKMSDNTGTSPLLKPASPSSGGNTFRLRIQGAYDADETGFRFHPDATSGFDKNWDATKFFQSPGYAGYPGPYTKYTTISSKDSMNRDYSINSNPPLTTSLSIPVLAKVSSTGTYTISAKDFQNFDMCVGLIDRADNSFHDLRLADYVCTINDSISTVRFDLVLCKDQSLETTSVKEVAAANNNVIISQDAQGAYVKTVFEKDTKAIISAFNIMGQKIMDDITVNGTVTTTHLPLNNPNQVVFVKVTSNSGMVSKKILLH